MLIFLGFDRSAGGPGPSLLSYNKSTDQVQNLGPLFPASSVYSYATGEGWYFSGTQATKLYTYLVGSFGSSDGTTCCRTSSRRTPRWT